MSPAPPSVPVHAMPGASPPVSPQPRPLPVVPAQAAASPSAAAAALPTDPPRSASQRKKHAPPLPLPHSPRIGLGAVRGMRTRAHANSETRAGEAADADAERAQEADVWDVVDPAYATMNTWSNIQGVLFGPSLHPPKMPTWADLVPRSSLADEEANPRDDDALSPPGGPASSRRASVSSHYGRFRARVPSLNHHRASMHRAGGPSQPAGRDVPQDHGVLTPMLEQGPTDPLGATGPYQPEYATDDVKASTDLHTVDLDRNASGQARPDADPPSALLGHVPQLNADDAPSRHDAEDDTDALESSESDLLKARLEEEARLAQEQAEEDAAVEAAIARLMSPRERFRRGLIGFGRYLKTPMGFLMVLYGLLIASWGIAIFILIVRWWNPPNRRLWIERCDKILCVLFNLTGFLLAPSRARDSYRMFRITWYRTRALKRRAELGLPPLKDPNDLPRSYAYRLYDTNHRRNLPPAEAVEATQEQLSKSQKEDSKAKLTPYQRRLRKKRVEEEAGVHDRVHQGTAAQAEMLVAEEAAAVAVAVSRTGGSSAITDTGEFGTVAYGGPRSATTLGGMSVASLNSAGAPHTIDLTAPAAERKRSVMSRIFHAAHGSPRRQHHSKSSSQIGQSTSGARVPNGDHAVSVSALDNVVTRDPSGDWGTYPPHRGSYSSAQAYSASKGFRPPLEINTRVGHNITRPPSVAPLLDENSSSSSGPNSPRPGSAIGSARPYVLVRSRSEYGAPKMIQASYTVTPDESRDNALAQDPSASQARLATVVSRHAHSTSTATALAAGAAVTVDGPDGRVAYAVPDDAEPAVLSLEEESQLVYQQRKFRSSHPYYRYHETETHRAFSTNLAIAIVILSDMHSMLQVALCGVTWGIEYHHRPTVLTAMIISCSLSCNATAGLLIWIGGNKTKKKEVVHAKLMRGLEAEARRRVRRARDLEAKARALAAEGKDPYPLQAKGRAALIKLNLYDLDGRHELPQIHGPFPSEKKQFWKRLWGTPLEAPLHQPPVPLGEDSASKPHAPHAPKPAPGSHVAQAPANPAEEHPLELARSPDSISVRSDSPTPSTSPKKEKDGISIHTYKTRGSVNSLRDIQHDMSRGTPTGSLSEWTFPSEHRRRPSGPRDQAPFTYTHTRYNSSLDSRF